jgi:hypothetical protein
MTGAEWADPLRRHAERIPPLFLLSLLVYPVLLFGAPAIYPWIAHPPPPAWLRFGWLAGRDAIALVVVCGCAAWFCASSAARPHSASDAPSVARRAGAFLLVYAVGSGLLTVDLVMSIDPTWVSTLFPAFVSISGLYAGIAAVVVVTVVSAPRSALDDRRANDAGRLLLGFGLLWMYLVWSQYLVIWYGNLPDETAYLLHRLDGNWGTLAWIVIGFRFVAPVVVCMSRAGRHVLPVTIVSVMVVCGFFLECVLLVGPAPRVMP